jgi:hypothetical protein
LEGRTVAVKPNAGEPGPIDAALGAAVYRVRLPEWAEALEEAIRKRNWSKVEAVSKAMRRFPFER